MERLTDIREQQVTDPAQRVGATYVDGKGVYVRLWAPKAETASIVWVGGKTSELTRDDHGYFTGLFPDARPGDRYYFLRGNDKIADPASRFQPEDVYGPSEVVALEYGWKNPRWRGVPYEQWVIYELHAGTYSNTHDFQGIIDDLPRLKDLGVTTIELMPVSQFSGARNWGYDGVFPHAVHHSYGGPHKLKELVDACHSHGLAIILDVVYNHIGPEGNVLYGCAPYAHDRYHTPWGDAINFDGDGSDEVRRYFLQTVWQWLVEYQFDGLRLDAVPNIYDSAPITFIEELSRLRDRAEQRTGREIILIAESDMNDPRYLASTDNYGYGMNAHWADDFHHILHVFLTGEKDGWFMDYVPTEHEDSIDMLARVYREGVAFGGRYSPYRNRFHGRPYAGIDKTRLIVQTQNHDQIGNRFLGERLITQIGDDKAKLAIAAVLLSPFTPLLFQGEEYGCTKPFMYFVSHHDHDLIEAVRKGRAAEWHRFTWSGDPPDPAGADTFDHCVLHEKAENAEMLDWYKALIPLSKELRSQDLWSERVKGTDCIALRFGKDTLVMLHFGDNQADIPLPSGNWGIVLQSTPFKHRDVTGKLTMPAFAATVLRKKG
jgi:maltooligosyltrehalose trehalohydrolase